jgi:hypothetical protein
MTTPQTTARVAPRFRTRPAMLLTALGVLVAIVVSAAILAPTGAHRTTITTTIPATRPALSSGSIPQIHYLGPRQVAAGLKPQSAPTGARIDHRGLHDAAAPAAGGSSHAPQYRCVPEKFCVRVR